MSYALPTATVIVVAYNGRHYLESCLGSVESQLGAGDELIVVDNASADGGPDLLRVRFPRVVLIENAENFGFAVACNQGATQARGDVLIFLNQDTQVKPGWLRALLCGLQEGNATDLATSKITLMSRPDHIQLCGQDVHFTGLVFSRGFGSPSSSMEVPAEVSAVAGASFAIRRDLWQALGGFDETLYMYYEETDLSWRARLRGYHSGYVPGSVVHHDYAPARPNLSRFYYTARNRYLLILKNWRLRTLLLLLPGLALAEAVDWFLALAMGGQGLRAKARANGWLLRRPGQIRAQRAAAQAGRTVSDAVILAERGYRLTPLETVLGPVGKAAVAVCNALFQINHRFALALCRWFGW